jgi:hypothetical protein
MSRILTLPLIRNIMNILISVTLIMGVSVILSKTYTLLMASDKINILRLEVPWFNPVNSVTLMLDRNILQQDTGLFTMMNKNLFAYDLMGRILFLPLIVLILIQLKKLLTAIIRKKFFELTTIRIIRNLSGVVLLWVLFHFIMVQVIPLFIPLELVIERINFTTIQESWLGNLIGAIDFRMLFVAIILYVISVSFREGYQLKEESDLTI